MTSIGTWLERESPRLRRGGVWTRGDLPGRMDPSRWDVLPYRVLVARLSTWEDTIESNTHDILHAILGDLPKTFPDLTWIPPAMDGEAMTEAGLPWLFGTTSRRPVAEFDCVALSNALVQETVNVAPLLSRSGIPLSRRERMAREDLPLVILGGANSLFTSIFFSDDPLVDGIFLGEEPRDIQRLFQLHAEARAEGLTKEAAFERLLQVPGFFLPSTRPTARKRHGSVPDLARFKPFEPLPAATGRAATATLQISEGCPFFCSFCAESWSRKPYRETPLQSLLGQARAIKRSLGATKVDLYSFNFNTHEGIRPLLGHLLEEWDSVGLKSQRFDAIAHDPTFARLLKIAGKTSITCGLEGISPRMRRFLQKDLSDQELKASLQALLRERLRELKVFTIATGLEEDEDFEEFRAFLKLLREMLDRAASRPRVTFSATPLVRFPWTPLEFSSMPSEREMSRRIGFIKAAAVSAGFEFREAAETAEAWVSQVLVRARDGRVLEAVMRAQERTGFVFRDVVSPQFRDALREELSVHGDPEQFVAAATPEDLDAAPWVGLDPGVSRRFLVSHWKSSAAWEQEDVCLGEVDRAGRCGACSACTGPEREAITHARRAAEQDLDALEARIHALRRTEETMEIEVELAPCCQGLPMDLIQARHAAAWMDHLDEVAAYRRHEAHGRQSDGDDCLASGKEVLRPVFLGRAAAKVREALADPQALEGLSRSFAPWGRIVGAAIPTSQSRWTLWSPAPVDLGPWLVGAGLKHTFRRQGEQRIWEPAKEALRKKVVLSAHCRPDREGWLMEITAGDKFRLIDFLRGAFAPETRSRLEVARIG